MNCEKIIIKKYKDLEDDLEKLNCKEVFYYDGIFEKNEELKLKEIEVCIYKHNDICFVIPAEKSCDIYPLIVKHDCASFEERDVYSSIKRAFRREKRGNKGIKRKFKK